MGNEQILMLFTSLLTQLDQTRGNAGAAEVPANVVSEAEDGGTSPADELREEAPVTLAARCCAHSRPSRSSFQYQPRRSSIKDLRLFGDSFAAGVRDSEFEYRYVEAEEE